MPGNSHHMDRFELLHPAPPSDAFPDGPAMEEALQKIRALGEELEAAGWQMMASARETTPEGHAINWLGLHLQELVDDAKLDEAYGAHLSNQEG